jgi:hypothetical protein
VADNIAWGNYQPNYCGGVQAWGGDGIIFDTLDGRSGLPSPYTAQTVAQNNIVIGNGGHGIEVQNNTQGSAHAPIYLAYNTSWGNEIDYNQQPNSLCAEVILNSAYNVHEAYNLAATANATECVGNPIYALSAYDVDGTASASNNFAFGHNGYHTFKYAAGSFTYDATNVLGVDPSLQNANTPGAPSCGGTGNVAACMAWLTTNFTPTNVTAKAYGHQLPGVKSVADPLFPQWLCGLNIPGNLITSPCPVGQ